MIEDEPPPPAQVLRPRTGKPFRNTGSMASPAAGAAPAKTGTLRVGKGVLIAVDDDDPHQGWAWDWPEDQDPSSSAHDPEHGFWTTPSAPAPLSRSAKSSRRATINSIRACSTAKLPHHTHTQQ